MASRPTQCKCSESKCSESKNVQYANSSRSAQGCKPVVQPCQTFAGQPLTYRGDAVAEMMAEARDQNRHTTTFVTRPLVFQVLANHQVVANQSCEYTTTEEGNIYHCDHLRSLS